MSNKKEGLDYCEMDYHNQHFWQLVGNKDFDYLIYRCSQCLKCKLVRIKFIDGNHIEEYNFKKLGDKK